MTLRPALPGQLPGSTYDRSISPPEPPGWIGSYLNQGGFRDRDLDVKCQDLQLAHQ